MNGKTLTILFVVMLLVVGVAVKLTQKNRIESSESPKFFPELMANLNDISEIQVNTALENFSIVRQNKQWGVKEVSNYPADLDKLHETLLGAAQLQVIEAKTSNPSLYSKIGVEDVDSEGSSSTLLTLKKDAETVLASVIVGNNRTSKADRSLREIYVRKPDDKQTWLVEGNLAPAKRPMDWLQKEIINIDNSRMKQAVITHDDGDVVHVLRENSEDNDYLLADVPENSKVKTPYELQQIATLLANLSLEDVKPVQEVEFGEKSDIKAVFSTFDGLDIALNAIKVEDTYYLQLSANYVESPKGEVNNEPKEEASEETELPSQKSAEEVKAEVEQLNVQFANWAYVIPQFKMNYLLKKKADLIEQQQLDLSPIDTSVPSMLEFGNPVTVSN